MNSLINRFWAWALLLAARRLASHRGYCANRSWFAGRFGLTEWNLTFTDCTQNEGYSREELYKMLQLVRKHEDQQGWTVPDDRPVVGAADILRG